MRFAQLKDGVFTGVMREFKKKPTPNPKKGFEWKRVFEDQTPAFDPATQKIERTTTVLQTRVSLKKKVVALSTAELNHVRRVKREDAIPDPREAIEILVKEINSLPGDRSAEFQALMNKVTPK